MEFLFHHLLERFLSDSMEDEAGIVESPDKKKENKILSVSLLPPSFIIAVEDKQLNLFSLKSFPGNYYRNC